MGQYTILNQSIAQGKDRINRVSKLGDELKEMLNFQRQENVNTVSRNVFEQAKTASGILRRAI